MRASERPVRAVTAWASIGGSGFTARSARATKREEIPAGHEQGAAAATIQEGAERRSKSDQSQIHTLTVEPP